jgi:hypothetical protein
MSKAASSPRCSASRSSPAESSADERRAFAEHVVAPIAREIAELAETIRTKQAAIREQRKTLGLAPGERILPPLDDPDGG